MSIKKMYQKAAVVLFVAAVLFFAVSLTVSAAARIDIIYAADTHADAGDMINVTISTAGGDSISTLGLRLYYDREKLTYQKDQWAESLQDSDLAMTLVSDAAYKGSQVLNISMISDGGYQDSGALVTLTFKVKEYYTENPFRMELREITDGNLQRAESVTNIVYRNTGDESGEGTGLSGEVTLKNDTLTYGETLSKLVFDEVEFVDRDKKSVDGILAWKNPEMMPNTGTTSAIWVFTPFDNRYEILEGNISITVKKAEYAPNMPESTMNISDSIEKVGDIVLPDGWEWQDADRDIVLKIGATVNAVAVYTGADQGNYENETVTIAITRFFCNHKAGEDILYTGTGEKTPTCTENGLGHRECIECGSIVESGIVVPLLGHSYTDKVTKEPTASADGERTYTCSRCGDTYTETIPHTTPEGLWISGLQQSFVYTGSAVKPEGICIYHGSTLLREKMEYDLTYKNNTKAGTAQIIVTGKGSYKGKAAAEFTIEAVDFSEDTNISASIQTATETGKKLRPAVTVTWNGRKLKEKIDYTLTYDADIKTVSTEGYDVAISGKGNYKGTIVRKFRVVPKGTPLLNHAKVAGLAKSYPYQEGKEIPERLNADLENLSVKIGKASLAKDIDYTVRIERGNAVGTGTVILEAAETSVYAGEKRISFRITGVSLKKCYITGLENTYPYTGKAVLPQIKMYTGKNGTGIQIPPDAYTVRYSDYINQGKASVTVSGVESRGYSGSVKATYIIGRLDLAAQESAGNITVTMPGDIKYAKGGAKPQPVITCADSGMLREGVDYILKYSGNTSAGGKTKPALTIIGTGNYCGTIIKNFDIGVQDIGILEITAADKAYNSKKKGSYYYSVPKVYDHDGKQLKSGRDYTVQYINTTTSEEIGKKDMIENGTKIRVTVTAAEKSGYTGTLSTIYYVRDAKDVKDIAKVKYDKIASRQYTGCEIKPQVGLYTLTGKTKNYLAKEDYEIVGYYNNIRKGTATILVRGTNSYSGVKRITFKITAADNQSIWSGIF